MTPISEINSEEGRRRKQSSDQRPPTQALKHLQERLDEFVSTVALAQTGLAVASGDPRHGVAGQITAQLGPPMVEAWVQLARERASVYRVLTRLTEGGAWGGVIFTTFGMIYSQLQAYEVLPRDAPNAWMGPFVPESDEATRNGDGNSGTDQ
jgi:hypothetical protein